MELTGSRNHREFTLKEVAAHCLQNDAWIIIDERVYDVTRFLHAHPGGIGPLSSLAGCDATDAFANYHTAKAAKMLPAFLIGQIAPGEITVPPHLKEFRDLREEMVQLGLFETSGRYYRNVCIWCALLLASSLYLSLGFSTAWSHMCGAALMGIFWQQVAGLGHDLGHSSVTQSFWQDHFIGSCLTAFMGLSLSWWKIDHNTHHVTTNSLDRDPNVMHLPIISITSEVFKGFYDCYHKKCVTMDRFAHLLMARQHIYFYPLMLFARWNLYAQGIKHLIFSEEIVHFRKTELFGLAIFFSWLLLLCFAMETGVEAVSWLLVSHAVAGILHVQIVLSHWASETYFGQARDDWYLTALKTSQDIRTPANFDWVHIGLQFQTAHHMFPRLPRHNLRIAQTMCKKVANKHFSGDAWKIFKRAEPYREQSFGRANADLWRVLRQTARASSKTQAHTKPDHRPPDHGPGI